MQVISSDLEHIYDCLPYQSSNPSVEEKERFRKSSAFFYNLKNLPSFEIRFGKLKKREDGFVQKGVDVLLATDIVTLSADKTVRHLILITGDADMVPAVKIAKDRGVKVHLFHIEEKGQYSDELYNCCDTKIPLEDSFLKMCIMK